MMKNVLTGIGALGALFGLSEEKDRRFFMAPPSGLREFEAPRDSRGKGQGGPSPLLALHRRLWGPRPTDPRHWHNPTNPAQAARIAAAQAKRQRKGAMLK